MAYTVLMIDGDRYIQNQMRAILGKDFNIKYAASSDSALKILSESDVQLILIDYKYYNPHKLSLFRNLSEFHKNLPLLLMKKTNTGRVQFIRIQ